ncbi:nitrate reductase delta subunit [Inhella inkyongensis]|uniref:Nitrate reductase delta subunit n=1 Tax=Inhella inkyongensis TaxID=392593 RepID=A0A840S9B7_9BURK|nr:nitrate reductase molybdenum cofactor assembly chaperone [Inhella inkyongensis]MBB5205000.1 nitrate reductase delta subunit [Inhella inkyongensis]
MAGMTHTLRVLAHLLRYPDAELRQRLPALREALHAEGALGAERRHELDALFAQLLRLDALQAEAQFVDLFDRGRRTALYLFEHVHGDSRDRGQAMVDLVQHYEAAGLLLDPGELPDHLPVVLEFASTQPAASARPFLAEFAHILKALFSALNERQSPYAAVLAAVLDLAGEPCEAVALPPEPTLDETWAEPEAYGGCSSQGQSGPQPIQIHRRRGAAEGASA